jgi:hypothetical protein
MATACPIEFDSIRQMINALIAFAVIAMFTLGLVRALRRAAPSAEPPKQPK